MIQVRWCRTACAVKIISSKTRQFDDTNHCSSNLKKRSCHGRQCRHIASPHSSCAPLLIALRARPLFLYLSSNYDCVKKYIRDVIVRSVHCNFSLTIIIIQFSFGNRIVFHGGGAICCLGTVEVLCREMRRVLVFYDQTLIEDLKPIVGDKIGKRQWVCSVALSQLKRKA